MMNSLRDPETLWVPERLIKERVGERKDKMYRGGKEGEEMLLS